MSSNTAIFLNIQQDFSLFAPIFRFRESGLEKSRLLSYNYLQKAWPFHFPDEGDEFLQTQHPQDERYGRHPDGTVRRFPPKEQEQTAPPAFPSEPASTPPKRYIPAPPRMPLRQKKAKRPHSFWLYFFALIGFLFVVVQGFRHLIVPLLVWLYPLTGGRL